jgi:hypothetical protein
MTMSAEAKDLSELFADALEGEAVRVVPDAFGAWMAEARPKLSELK